ncbi:MAG: SLATT domain-containing protein [Chloroflexota bacterium]
MTQQSPEIPILKVAWTRYAQMDVASSARTRTHLRLRRWIAIFGVLSTLFAVLVQAYPANFPVLGSIVLKALLIAAPITTAGLAYFASKKYASGDWLALRAGAEGIQRELYTYRTILQGTLDRRAWLEKRLADIQRQVYRSVGGKLVLKPYSGKLPPYFNPDNPNSDPGYHDINGDEYYRYRLQSQLAWHIKKVNQYETEQTRLTIWILLAGTSGTLLAGLGALPGWTGLTLWVALTASISAAFMAWEELRNLEATIKNYSKVILELNLLAEHWENLEPEERTQKEFFDMVRSTEEILWSQNIEYIKSMQEALASVQDEDNDLVNQILRKAREADAEIKQSIYNDLLDRAEGRYEEAKQDARQAYGSALDTIRADAASERAQEEFQQILAASGLIVSALNENIKRIAEEFAGIEFGKETPKEVLHAKMSQYPSTGQLKG